MAPMNSSDYEPEVMKGDLLVIDMSVKEATTGDMYVNRWTGDTNNYVNYCLKSQVDGEVGISTKFPQGTKGHTIGMENTFYKDGVLEILGKVVGRYTQMSQAFL